MRQVLWGGAFGWAAGTRRHRQWPAMPEDNGGNVAVMDALETLLTRSQAFVEHLLSMLARVEDWDDSPRPAACMGSCQLSLEHSQAVSVLFATELPNAACVALRAQYEAVL